MPHLRTYPVSAICLLADTQRGSSGSRASSRKGARRSIGLSVECMGSSPGELPEHEVMRPRRDYFTQAQLAVTIDYRSQGTR